MALNIPAWICYAFVYFADNETNTELFTNNELLENIQNILNVKFPKDQLFQANPKKYVELELQSSFPFGYLKV